MKYKELEKIAVKAEWTITENQEIYSLEKVTEEAERRITIGKIYSSKVIFINNDICRPEDFAVIKASIELAETPLDERQEEKRYIVPLPHLITSDGEQQYLTQKGKNWFACWRTTTLRQTWKEKHLKYIPEEYRKYAVEVEE